MSRIGICGLPNTGKTTLFNALTGLGAITSPHPFSTTQPNLGVVKVPDPGLEEVASLEGSAKAVHATLELLDAPALQAGRRPTPVAGLGAQFLGRLREMDALAVVLRAFDDPGVSADESGTDPVVQAQDLALQLGLADLEIFERRRERLAKEAAADPSKRGAALAMGEAIEALERGEALRRQRWGEEARGAFRDLAPLTLKPVVWVVNLAENDPSPSTTGVEAAVPPGDPVVALSA
ncbi:MAG: GTPase, partial [Acidimicrobiia bacterium]